MTTVFSVRDAERHLCVVCALAHRHQEWRKAVTHLSQLSAVVSAGWVWPWRCKSVHSRAPAALHRFLVVSRALSSAEGVSVRIFERDASFHHRCCSLPPMVQRDAAAVPRFVHSHLVSMRGRRWTWAGLVSMSAVQAARLWVDDAARVLSIETGNLPQPERAI